MLSLALPLLTILSGALAESQIDIFNKEVTVNKETSALHEVGFHLFLKDEGQRFRCRTNMPMEVEYATCEVDYIKDGEPLFVSFSVNSPLPELTDGSASKASLTGDLLFDLSIGSDDSAEQVNAKFATGTLEQKVDSDDPSPSLLFFEAQETTAAVEDE